MPILRISLDNVKIEINVRTGMAYIKVKGGLFIIYGISEGGYFKIKAGDYNVITRTYSFGNMSPLVLNLGVSVSS